MDIVAEAPITAGMTKYGLDSLPSRLPKTAPSARTAMPTRPSVPLPKTVRGRGQSWRWQLRDRFGRWIEMGSEVEWFSLGALRVGKIVDSPDKSTAIVQTSDGRKTRIPTARLNRISTPPGSKAGKAPVTRVPHPTVAGEESVEVPSSFKDLSDEDLVTLYWKSRNHPKVSTRKWGRVAAEVARRRLSVDPSTWLPAGAFTSSGEWDDLADLTAAEVRYLRMTVRLIEAQG